jgi:hypothetical protein
MADKSCPLGSVHRGRGVPRRRPGVAGRALRVESGSRLWRLARSADAVVGLDCRLRRASDRGTTQLVCDRARSQSGDSRPGAPRRDRRGRSLYLYCEGSGSPTVSWRPGSAAPATTGARFSRTWAARRAPASTTVPGWAVACRSRGTPSTLIPGLCGLGISTALTGGGNQVPELRPASRAWPPPTGRDYQGPQRGKQRGRHQSQNLRFARGSTTPTHKRNDL